MHNQPRTKTPIVLMGPAGSGKTTLGRRLAERWGRPFEDADEHHSQGNISKMRRGIGLSDEDRAPWLERLAALLRDQPETVLACSALRESYRTTLRRGNPDVLFVFLKVPAAELSQRLERRQDHYAGSRLIEGQLATLEEPADDEPGTVSVFATGEESDVFSQVRDAIEKRSSWHLSEEASR